MPYLIVSEPGRVTYTVLLRDGLRVGREEDNELVLGDRQVSRQHLRFELVDGAFEACDLGSTHGTLRNGAPIERHRLADRDHLQLGNVLCTFVDAEEPGDVVVATTATAPPAATAPAPATATVAAPAAATPRRDRLALFYELSAALGALGDTDRLLGQLLATTVEMLGCERGLIGLREAGRPTLRRITPLAAGDGGAAPALELVLSRTVREALLERRQAVIVSRASGEMPRSLVASDVRAAMGAPLIFGNELLGLVYVDDRARDDRFAAADLEFLTALAHLIAAALASAERYQRVAVAVEALREDSPTDALLGGSEAMQRLKQLLKRYAAAPDTRVFIHGETGTGKELIARTLHQGSPRAAQPFVAVNCAAIPETMIESELFGHEKGAFTGALRDRRGKLVLAHGGTLFLDEVGDLSLAAQAKLLRAIEEGEVQPLGAERSIHVDVRVISATHKDLQAEIAEKRFRSDLYYRLCVVELSAPPLRERGDDVALLAQSFLARSSVRVGKRLTGFTRAALQALARHSWPGNVRELQNEVERAALLAEGPVVDAGDLSPRLLAGAAGVAGDLLGDGATLAARYAQLETIERQLVEEALAKADGNVAEAARLVGITRVMMKRRVDRLRSSE